MTKLVSWARAAAAGVACATLAACASPDIPTAPGGLRSLGTDVWGNVGGFDGAIFACKAGGPAGTYYFHAEKSGGGDSWFPYGQDATVEFNGTDMVCAHMWSPLNEASWGVGVTGTVTISEVSLPEGMQVDLIRVWDSRNQVFLSPDVTGSSSVTITVNHDNNLFYTKFYNGEAPPPPDGQGCTPGYWKVSQHWDSWIPTGLSTTQTVGSVFSNASLYSLQSYTLVQGLSFKGGSKLAGAARILLRAAIAAELNALSPGIDYAMAAGDIVAQVNDALLSGDRATMIGLGGTLDYYNNKGCPLN